MTQIEQIKNWTLYKNEKGYHIEGYFKNHHEILVPFVSVQMNYDNIYEIVAELRSPYVELKHVPKYAKDKFIKAIQADHKRTRQEQQQKELKERAEWMTFS